MNNSHFLFAKLLFVILFCTVTVIYTQAQSDEAKKYYDRGQAAIELAQTQADYNAAIAEFTKAINLAPNWADVYFALGQVQEKIENYADAITNYKKYLALAPTASNAATVQTFINKLEYRLDKANEKKKIMDVLTKWNIPGSYIKFSKTGNDGSRVKKFILTGDRLDVIIDEQPLPVEFDGRILKFKYVFYHCPGLPESHYCISDVTITGELISASPIKFKIVEEWKNRGNGKTDIYNSEWLFSE